MKKYSQLTRWPFDRDAESPGAKFYCLPDRPCQIMVGWKLRGDSGGRAAASTL